MCRTLDKKAFEELLLYLRNQNEITQKTLSDILNTTSTTISKWENGNCAPDIDALFGIADYFHLTKEIEEGVNFISLSFRLDNETTPYYVWGKMITPSVDLHQITQPCKLLQS